MLTIQTTSSLTIIKTILTSRYIDFCQTNCEKTRRTHLCANKFKFKAQQVNSDTCILLITWAFDDHFNQCFLWISTVVFYYLLHATIAFSDKLLWPVLYQSCNPCFGHNMFKEKKWKIFVVNDTCHLIAVKFFVYFVFGNPHKPVENKKVHALHTSINSMTAWQNNDI